MDKKPCFVYPQKTQFSAKNSNMFLQTPGAADLTETYENKQLKSKLKEIAKNPNEEDNPVLVAARFK